VIRLASAGWVALGCAISLALGTESAAQSPASPPPEGLEAGEGAGYPKGHYAELDTLPDWGGIWFLNRTPPGSPRAEPALVGSYLEQFRAWQDEVRANDGVERRTRSNCSPPGMPRVMQLAQYPYEFIFSPGRVTVNQEAWMQTRTIWTDGRTHPPLEEIDPTYMGHSIGRWEADTLVVDTIGVLTELPFFSGMLRSERFRITERIGLDPDNPDRLINRMTMEDPEALAAPFEVTVSYRRDRNGQLYEFQCSENNRNPVDENGATLFE
jgi:hypothetical protein